MTVALHRDAPGDARRRTCSDALLHVAQAMTNAGYATRSTRSSPRPTRRRSRAAPASATRRPAGRARRSAAAASGTATPTGPTTPSSPTINNTIKQRGRADRAAERQGRSTCSTRSTAAGCARTRSACSRRRASPTGRRAGAVDKTEWVRQIRTRHDDLPARTSCRRTAHPSYWGQLALRNCLRQAYNGGAVRGGRACARPTGSTRRASRTWCAEPVGQDRRRPGRESRPSSRARCYVCRRAAARGSPPARWLRGFGRRPARRPAIASRLSRRRPPAVPAAVARRAHRARRHARASRRRDDRRHRRASLLRRSAGRVQTREAG